MNDDNFKKALHIFKKISAVMYALILIGIVIMFIYFVLFGISDKQAPTQPSSPSDGNIEMTLIPRSQ
jgi:hypothetical protein